MNNSKTEKTLSQKINIIVAMSSDGEVWISLTTCNTDSNVLMLFMTQLASVLTKESPNWRDSTVFLFDGVSELATGADMTLMQCFGSLVLTAARACF